MTMEMLRARWEWFVERAHGGHAKAWLSILSFTESAVFVVPPDPLLVAILLAGNSRWLYYGILTSALSVAGAIFGYILGAFFYDVIGAPLVEIFRWQDEMETVRQMYQQDAFVAILIGAFTPIPYKVFVLGAGFFRIDFFVFLLASIIGRGARYIGIAFATRLWGMHVLEFMRRYSLPSAIIAALLLAVYIARNVFF